jgi:uncharacterized protein (TIGR03083 family)
MATRPTAAHLWDGGGASRATEGVPPGGRSTGRYGACVATIVDKLQTLTLLGHEFDAVTALVSELTDDQWATASCLPGWTVHDVLGHMIGTELMLSGRPAPGADVSHLEHMKNPVAEANEIWVESLRPLSGAELVATWTGVTAERLAALGSMTQADFDAPSWTPVGNDETYGRFMRIRHYDCYMHEQDIRLALGVPGRDDPDDVASCLDEVATGLGYIVGRKAGMPDGSRVQIDLTGEVERTFLVQVAGRAAVVDALEGSPTVRIELPVGLFLRLTGGRDDGPSEPSGRAHLDGDLSLARQLVENLAFTI